jgi:hypothetical protein
VERLILALVLAGAAAAVAFLLQRRHPDAPTRTGYTVPDQVDRADFDRPEAPWLVAVFTSSTCRSCAGTWDKARHLASDAVVVQEVEVVARKDLHDRYEVEAVPIVIVADAAGAVRASFLGPPTATDLWASLAELRDPGSVPDSCDHGQGQLPP